LESAVKGPGSIKARVDRLADLLNRSVAVVIKDGELHDDLATATWDDEEREKGKWVLDHSQRSPDLSDAGGYPLSLPLFTEVGGRFAESNLESDEDQAKLPEVRAHEKYLKELHSGKAKRKKRKPLEHIMWNPPPSK